MNETHALAEVEQKYGSLEDFVLFLLTEMPLVLENEWSLEKKAKETGLSLRSLAFLLNRSAKFRSLIRADLVNQEFDLLAERDHISAVVGIARNNSIRRISPSGEEIEVDQNPGDIIKAGEYLNKYRSTPLDGGQKSTLVGLQVVFGGGESREVVIANEEKTIEIAAGEGAGALPTTGYRPSRAGDPPPEGVRSRYASAGDGPEFDPTARAGGELDFNSREAEEKARDQEIAEKSGRSDAPARRVEAQKPLGVPTGGGNEVVRAALRNLKARNEPKREPN